MSSYGRRTLMCCSSASGLPLQEGILAEQVSGIELLTFQVDGVDLIRVEGRGWRPHLSALHAESILCGGGGKAYSETRSKK